MSSVYLDTAIAVFFVFLLFSVIGYVVQEWWAALREKRARMLEFSIHEALNDRLNKDFGTLLYEHPQIDLLRETQSHLPAYIPAENFASALIDLISRQTQLVSYQTGPSGLLEEVKTTPPLESTSFDKFKQGVANLNYSDVKTLLESFQADASNQKELKTNIEDWFNRYMDRVSGWYRSHTRINLRVISIILVVAFNVDALFLVQSVFQNEQLRETLVAAAEDVVDNPSGINEVLKLNLNDQLREIDSLYKSRIESLDTVGADSSEKSVNLKRQELLTKWSQEKLALIDSTKNLREKQFTEWVAKINSYGLPIGWNIPDSSQQSKGAKEISKGDGEGRSFWQTLKKVVAYFEYWQNADNVPGMSRRTVWTILLGWAISATCISFGAPFWFNALSKLVQIRRTGIKPTVPSDEKK